MFLSNDFNFDILDKKSEVHTSDLVGHSSLKNLCISKAVWKTKTLLHMHLKTKKGFTGSRLWGIMYLELMIMCIT